MTIISRKEKEKKAREEDIINAAEKVFTSMGFNGASMEVIAKEAQFTRKTLYQYFSDKEDLYFSIISRGFERLLSYIQNDIQDNKTGFENLQTLTYSYYRFFQNYPDTFALMNYVGHIKSCNEDSINYQNYSKSTTLVAHEVSKIIDEGKSDGSIRTDLDTMNITYSAEFLLTGFFNMLSLSGKTFTNQISINQEDFVHFNINLICDAFRAKR